MVLHRVRGPEGAPGPQSRSQISDLVFVFLSGVCSLQTDVVGEWVAQQEKETRLLNRPKPGQRLFQNLTRGNRYLVQAEGYLNGSGHSSEMALTWNRTALPGGSVSYTGPHTYTHTHLIFHLQRSSRYT